MIVTSVFKKEIKKLRKKYPSVTKIFEQIIDDLTKSPGIGDEISGHQGFFKVRYANPDAKKGKSGGFRVIYFFDSASNLVILVSIYSKSEQEDVNWDSVNKAMLEQEDQDNGGI